MEITQQPKIYVRLQSGLCYQAPLIRGKTIQKLFQDIFGKLPQNNVRVFNKGRIIEMQQTFQACNINNNEIIHFLDISSSLHERGYIYLSYDDKIFRINFSSQQSVKQFKQTIYQETELQPNQQLVLYCSMELKDEKLIHDYYLQTGDFLCMTKRSNVRPIVIDIPHVIYPDRSNLEKRKRSYCHQSTKRYESVKRQKLSQNHHLRSQFYRGLYSPAAKNLSCSSPVTGPSPLSQQDNIFKAYMEQWFKDHPETISENFNQEINLTEYNCVTSSQEQPKMVQSSDIHNQERSEKQVTSHSCEIISNEHPNHQQTYKNLF